MSRKEFERTVVMDKDRLLECQKYYIFKIRDLVNNSFHTLEEKRMECLLEYLDLCISTYDEYRLTLDPGKLKRSYEGLIEVFDYQVKNHPFRKLDYYRNDFLYLRKLISLNLEQRDKELHNIHRNMVALRKKMDAADMIGHYILCLKQEESFGGMDNLMEALVSDLLYKGYSLAYLFDWFRKQQDEFMKNGQDVSIIDNLRELDRKATGYTIYIKFMINSHTQLRFALQLLEKKFIIKKREDYSFSGKWSEKEFYIASKEYQALDVTKAILMASKEFNDVKELFEMWQGVKGGIQDDIRYGFMEDGKFKLLAVKKADNIKMLEYVDTYYKKQMERFLKLKDSSENEDIKALERILYTLNTAKTYKEQNRFLNFWSALEYALYPFPRFTIIEKARVVVPEVFSLFFIKNKMNIFWARLTHYLESRMDDSELENVIRLYRTCVDVEDGSYHTQKLIAVIQEQENVENIADNFSKHVVLKREWSELQMLITSPEKALKAIRNYYDGIMHDLNYIYRIRNQLIHSTKGANDSLGYVSMRLYRYVNSVLSTILYYKEKNGEFTITDILSSIDATYQDYTSSWNSEKSKKKQKNQDEEKWDLEEAYKIWALLSEINPDVPQYKKRRDWLQPAYEALHAELTIEEE